MEDVIFQALQLFYQGKFSREGGSYEQFASDTHRIWGMGISANTEGKNRAPIAPTIYS